MSATRTPSLDGVDEGIGVTHAGESTDAGQFTPGTGRSYSEQQRRGRRQSRTVRFAVGVPLWALAAVPLARELADGGSAEVVFTYLAVAAASLGVAAAIRLLYLLVRKRTKRTLLTPGVFLIAAVLVGASYVVHTGGEPVPEPLAASAPAEH
jgi:hypothetical protein